MVNVKTTKLNNENLDYHINMGHLINTITSLIILVNKLLILCINSKFKGIYTSLC